MSNITVVVITHNRRHELLASLASLRHLPERPPVIVVDNGSGDGTVPTVRAEASWAQVLPLGHNAGGAGRNAGVRLAQTPYVAFCDDDTRWSPGSLDAARRLMDESPRLAVVTARIVVEPDGVLDPVCADMADSPLPTPLDSPGSPLMSFLAGASVVRRSAFLAAGGFEPYLLIGGEEELLASRLADGGWAMSYAPELEIHHRASALRDPHLRRQQGIRNTLWYTWLRRPLRSALHRSFGLLCDVPRDRVTLSALSETVGSLAWVLGNRHSVSTDTEINLRMLDQQQLASRARRYVS